MNLVKINSINIWDEETESGGFTWASGVPYDNANQYRSKNFTNVVAGNYYCLCSNSDRIIAWYYQENGTFISYADISNSVFLVPNGATKMKLSNLNTGVFNHNIQICLNSESQKTTYHPHWVLGLDGQGKAFTADISSMLPSGIGVVDLGECDWLYDTSNNMFGTNAYPVIIPQSADAPDIVYACCCSKYFQTTQEWMSHSDKTINMRKGLMTAGRYSIVLKDTDYTDATALKNALKGEMFFYKKY